MEGNESTVIVAISVKEWLERVEEKVDNIHTKLDQQNTRITKLETLVDIKAALAGIIGIGGAIASAIFGHAK